MTTISNDPTFLFNRMPTTLEEAEQYVHDLELMIEQSPGDEELVTNITTHLLDLSQKGAEASTDTNLLNRNIKVLTDELNATEEVTIEEEIIIEETITKSKPEPKESKDFFKKAARKAKEIYNKTVDVIVKTTKRVVKSVKKVFKKTAKQTKDLTKKVGQFCKDHKKEIIVGVAIVAAIAVAAVATVAIASAMTTTAAQASGVGAAIGGLGGTLAGDTANKYSSGIDDKEASLAPVKNTSSLDSVKIDNPFDKDFIGPLLQSLFGNPVISNQENVLPISTNSNLDRSQNLFKDSTLSEPLLMHEFNKCLDSVETNHKKIVENPSISDSYLSQHENIWDKRSAELQRVFTDCSTYPQPINEADERMQVLNIVKKFNSEENFRNHSGDWHAQNAHDILGKERTRENFLMSEVYKVGDKELKNGKIIYINGIDNTLEDSQESTNVLSQYSEGASITSVYNATHGKVNDLNEARKNMNGIVTTPSFLLANEIISYFNAHPDDSKVLIVCHSQGTAHTNNTLYLLPKDIRKRIEVAAIAPSKYIDDSLCRHVGHYLSENDAFVPNIDKERRIAEKQGTVHLLEPALGTSEKFDHAFLSETYQSALKVSIRDFIKKQKGLSNA